MADSDKTDLFDSKDRGSDANAGRVPIWTTLFGLGDLDDRSDRFTLAVLLAFIFMVFFGPIMTLSDTGATGDAGNSIRQIGYLVIFGLAVATTRPQVNGWSVLAIPISIIIALVWCWLSLTWAVVPGIVFRRLLLTTIVVWTVFIILRGAGYRLTVGGLRMALVVALLLNFATVMAMPETGIHLMQDSAIPTALIGNWRGFMAHKNFAGAACALTMLMFIFDAREIAAWFRVVIVLLSGIFLFQSQSKTSAGMAGLSILIGYAYQRLSGRARAFVIPTLTIFASGFWMLYSTYWDVISSNVLNPTAFTGRGQIWSAMFAYILDHPILGAGFGSFWNVGDDSPIYHYGKGYVTFVTVGHNGYLDLAVTVGIPGVMLAIFALSVWPMVRLLTSHGLMAQRGGLTCALLVFGVGHNVTESSIFARDAIVGVFMLFTAGFAEYSISIRSRRKRKPDGADVMKVMRRRHRSARSSET